MFSLFFTRVGDFSAFVSTGVTSGSSFYITDGESSLLGGVVVFFPSRYKEVSTFGSSGHL